MPDLRAQATDLNNQADQMRKKAYKDLERADALDEQARALRHQFERERTLDSCRSKCGKCRRKAAKWLASSTNSNGERWPVCDPCKDLLIEERKPQTIYFESVAHLLEVMTQ